MLISALTAAGALAGTELVVYQQGATTVKGALSALVSYASGVIAGQANTFSNALTVQQSSSAGIVTPLTVKNSAAWVANAGAEIRLGGGASLASIRSAAVAGANDADLEFYTYSGAVATQALALGPTGAASFATSVTVTSTLSSKLALTGGTSQNGLLYGAVSGGHAFYHYSLSTGFQLYDNTSSLYVFSVDNTQAMTIRKLGLTTPTSQQIATGHVTYSGTFLQIDTEGLTATDQLDYIDGGVDGSLCLLVGTNSARAITVKRATGNILMDADYTMSQPYHGILFYKFQSWWLPMCKWSDN